MNGTVLDGSIDECMSVVHGDDQNASDAGHQESGDSRSDDSTVPLTAGERADGDGSDGDVSADADGSEGDFPEEGADVEYAPANQDNTEGDERDPPADVRVIRRLVLIDDESSVLFALKLLLSQVLGYEVRDFPSPISAIEFLQDPVAFAAYDPDLIICDLKMPRMNGLAVLTEAKRLHAALPFVLMSAHATTEEVARAKSLGAYGFLAKPFTPAQLNEVIEGLAALKLQSS